MLYDVTDRESFENLNHLNDLITIHAPENVQKIVIGNKSDLLKTANNIVPYNDAVKLCKELNIPNCVQVSAKNGDNIDKAMQTHIIPIQQNAIKRKAPFCVRDALYDYVAFLKQREKAEQ